MALFDHVRIKVRDLQRCRAFYTAVMGSLGYGVVLEADSAIGFGENSHDMFEISETAVTAAISTATHIAFNANSEDAVRLFHAVALEHGATDNGAPGLRRQYGEGYFAAFVIDLNGHNLEAVFSGQRST